MNNISQLYVFNNPFLQRKEIFKLTKNMPGCYIWLNRINSKCYVGSSINLARRLKFYYSYNTHKLKFSSLIISALLSHGMNNFSLIVIIVPDSNSKEVLKLEQFLIDNYNSEYNILKIAGLRTGHTYSSESKALMSQSNLKYNSSDYNIFGNGFINVYSSDKTFLNQYPSAKEAGRELNISDVSIFKYMRTGRLFKNMYYFSKDLLDNNDIALGTTLKGVEEKSSQPSSFVSNKIKEKVLSKSKSTKPVRIYIYSPDLVLLYEFDSVSESARKLEIPRTTISTYLDTRKIYKNKYIFNTYSLT